MPEPIISALTWFIYAVIGVLGVYATLLISAAVMTYLLMRDD